MNYQVFLTLILILFITVFSISVLRTIGLPTLFGFLIAGIGIGPYALDVIKDNQTITMLGDYGIVLLLFLMGLELKKSTISERFKEVFLPGLFQFLFTTFLFTFIGLILQVSLTQSFLIAIALAYCSQAIPMQLLTRTNNVGTKFGKSTFGILLFQDMMIIPFLAIFPILAMHYTSTKFDILEIVAVISASFLFFKFLLSPFLRLIAKTKAPEMFALFAITIVLFNSIAISFVGLPLPLAAFLSGVMLADSEYRNQIHADLIPFKGILLGLFFMMIGSSLDLSVLKINLLPIIQLVAVLILVKASVIYFVARTFSNTSKTTSLKTGLLLSSVGEFSIIVFKMMNISYHLINETQTQILYFVVLFSMMLTPFMFALIKLLNRKNINDISNENQKGLSGHVIIAGFGRVGQTVAYLLQKSNIPYCAIDLDPDRVEEGRTKGINIYYGDATRYEILKSAGAERAAVAVIALDNAYQNKKVITSLKQSFPGVQIFARARNHMEGDALKEFGVAKTVPETTESSLQLGGVILSSYGMSHTRIHNLLHEVRAEDYKELKDIIEKNVRVGIAKTIDERKEKINKALGIQTKKSKSKGKK